ncbi:MAG: hypothetical protein M1826_004125 [Phylliscum demangeonii]|nr:MAG: hypothetical protein M1826_004125 [Phylliscum demangeonii]
MASIFTFDPEPPRVLSPWAKLDGVSAAALKETEETSSSVVPGSRGSAGLMPNPAGITKLVAEPQLGPTEYKLHLLLRPRRRYTVLTTGTYVAGSQHFKPGSSPTTSGRDPSTSHVESPRLSPLPPNQSQHYRLQQLTTQLLWRLQQSLPHHSSSATASSTPSADPADPRLQRSGLLPGLEESHGALYEIGVSDEGTCVGLARDELEESLATLGVMARSLGCAVQVLRRVVVGTCEWMEETEIDVQEEKRLRRDNLWVAEALVKPICQGSDHSEPARPVLSSSPSQPTEREQDAAADGFQVLSLKN